MIAVVGPLLGVGFDPIPIEQLAQRAELIVQGTVLSKSCQRDLAGRIYTRVQLTVEEVWKGAVAGSPFEIVHGGGILGDRQSVVSGQVDYAIGEEVVAFLVRNTRGEALTLGLMQGKFHVWKDAQTGVKNAVSPFHGVADTTASKAVLGMRSAGSSPGRLSVAELKRRVLEVSP